MAMSKNPEQRVAIFSLAYLPFVGGAELAIKEIAARLPYQFICFTRLFDSHWPNKEIMGSVTVSRSGSGGGGYYGHPWKKAWYVFQAWRAAEAEHRRQPFSAVWAMMAAYAGIAALLFKWCHPSVPLLLTLQEGDSEAHILRRVGIWYPFWKQLFRKADRIQVISTYLAEFARRHGARCPIEVVPNGVDLKNFEISAAGQRIKLAQADDIKVIITTSRLVPKNGIDVLIRAVAELKNTAPAQRLKLMILGEGPEQEKLKKLAGDLGVGRETEFVGHVDPAGVGRYLFLSDVFVRPSRSEGLGSSFLEAMAAGVPIIGTAVGGIPDFLKHGETGLVVKVDDPKDLTQKIKQILADGGLRQRLANNGARLVRERYTWESVAHKMRQLFSQLIINY